MQPNNKDKSCTSCLLSFSCFGYFALSAIGYFMSLMAATSSSANSAISMTKSTSELIGSVDNVLNNRNENTTGFSLSPIDLALVVGFSTLILAFSVSILYQRVTKNSPKVLETITSCVSDKTKEQTSSSEVLAEGNNRALRYTIHDKCKPALPYRLIDKTTFISKLILSAGSAVTLVDLLFGLVLHDPTSPARKTLDGLSAIVVGASTSLSFYAIMAHERNNFDVDRLLHDHIQEKFKERSPSCREKALWVLRHILVDLSIFFSELADFTTFEVMATVLFGKLDDYIQLLGVLMCLSIAITKYGGYHDKMRELFFSCLSGKVYEEDIVGRPTLANTEPVVTVEHVNEQTALSVNEVSNTQRKRQCQNNCCFQTANKITCTLTAVGTVYNIALSTTYQTYKNTGLWWASGALGLISGVLGCVNTLALLHDIDSVPVERREPALENPGCIKRAARYLMHYCCDKQQPAEETRLLSAAPQVPGYSGASMAPEVSLV